MPLARLLGLLALAALTLAAPARAQGTDVAPILARFALDRFPDTQAAIEALAASGHPTAQPVLEALNEGRLFVRTGDRAIVWRDASGPLRLAVSGEAVADAPTRPVRVSNAIRRSLELALGNLSLLAPDPARRLEAARALFRTRQAASLPLLRTALERERDLRVKRAFLEAQAAIVVTATDAPELDRIAAATVLADRGDREAQGVLRAAAVGAPERLAAEIDTSVRAIETRLSLLAMAQNLVYGLSLGSVLLLAAVGLAITFGVMGVINMAHGEMVMIGAYTTFVVQEAIRLHAPHLFDASLLIALPLAFLVAGTVGMAIERSVIRLLYGRPLETLLATWGVSLILQQAVRTIFGPSNREVGNPSFMSGSLDVLGLTLTWNRLWIIGFALAVFLALLFTLRFTSFGLRMRAVVQNRRMAASMGIRTHWLDALTFGLGSGIAGVAGVALSQIDNVSPNLGQSYIIDSFMVVVFGGVGSLWGTLVAALTLGTANKLLEPYAGAVLGKILVLVFIILFIQKRPRGLFALKGRAVES
ncbi:urea ABC transporter permease subunit UrtB [Salinarimonas soli]|uniref:Urea ABC transporter permease subunit UrtB n=1 Tax=Salinarimonas soli TaxID=1638099 RepID=A0A5B2VYZ2_9HYPH|nr:urea ABC transporter permease subunit UrtB [Salinarimonas soli]KAA2244235.1 urea ABC transporter permease subunit UrtB [Salinarimonas soli]